MASPNPVPAQDQIFESDDLAAEIFWQKNRKLIITSVVALVVVALGIGLWIFNSHRTRLAAESLFASAQNPDAWREVIAKYPKSEPAANAYFLLAESLREKGDVAESTETYQKFLQAFPTSPLVAGARLGIAENLDLTGKTDESLAALRDVQTKNAGSYAAPVAALYEGRIYLRQGKLEEARRVFSTLISTSSQSPAAQIAGMQLEQIAPLLPPKADPAP